MDHHRNHGLEMDLRRRDVRIHLPGFALSPPEGGHYDRIGRYDRITTNHDATMGPSGPRPRPRPASGGGAFGAGGGAGPRSGWNKYALCVFGSTQMVFAPATVCGAA